MSAIPEEKYAKEKEYVLSSYPNAEIERAQDLYVVLSNDKMDFRGFLGIGKRIDKAWKRAAMYVAEINGEYKYGMNWKKFIFNFHT